MKSKIMLVIVSIGLLISSLGLAQTPAYYCPTSVTCPNGIGSCTMQLYSSDYKWVILGTPNGIKSNAYVFGTAWANVSSAPGGIECQYPTETGGSITVGAAGSPIQPDASWAAAGFCSSDGHPEKCPFIPVGTSTGKKAK